MSAASGRQKLQELLVLTVVPFAVAVLAVSSTRAADAITVALDHAELTQVPERTATIVVGNPAIADVSLQAGGVLVVTGKGYGATNFLALDRGGRVLSERQLLVRAPTDNIISVYHGKDRETLSCEPICQPRTMLGDAPAYFTPTIQQSGSRNGQASGAAAGGSGSAAPR
jgi:Pilus formation protein N terminal region